MANENDLIDAKIRTWRALAVLLETLGGLAAKLDTMAHLEQKRQEAGAAERRGRS